jgi:addiction module antidote protein, HigA family
MAADTVMAPVHPGEILLEEFLKPLAVSQYKLAKEIGVPARRINEIVHGQRRISADTALRLARFFGTSERFWINLQARYDLETEKDRLGDALDGIRRSALPADRLWRLRALSWKGVFPAGWYGVRQPTWLLSVAVIPAMPWNGSWNGSRERRVQSGHCEH